MIYYLPKYLPVWLDESESIIILITAGGENGSQEAEGITIKNLEHKSIEKECPSETPSNHSSNRFRIFNVTFGWDTETTLVLSLNKMCETVTDGIQRG